MKRFKKMMAIAIVAMMTLMYVVPSMAATGGLTVDDHIAVNDLQEGDVVNFYRVLKWDDGWKLDTGFTLTDAELKTVVGNATTAGEISSTIAGKLGTQAANATAAYGSITANASGVARQNSPTAGLYIAIITPKAGSSGYTYNPVFVAADYSRESAGPSTSDTNEWDVTTALSYSDEAMAKKAEIDVEKEATDGTTNDDNTENTVRVGDIVTFTVTTTIPGFADNYTSPVFKVSDSLSAGLALTANSVTLNAPTGLTEDKYTIDETAEGKGKDGFVLNFDSEYLKTVKTATEVKITYTATVTSDAESAVNPENNTVTVNYSNAPNDIVGHGVLKDKTNHYSFSIDAKLFGNQGYHTTEVVKVGVDKNGVEISKSITLDNGNKIGALEGAEFKLLKADKTAYTNEYIDADSVIVSDANGRLKVQGASEEGIRGLDAGVYYLRETKAPDGYIKLTEDVKIEIKTVVEEKEYTEVVEGQTVTYKTNELVSFTIEIGGVETAYYEMHNDPTNSSIHVSTSIGDSVVGIDESSGKLKNTKGVELPSTGGMGTTLFYIIGAILIIGAGVLLVTRRRTENAE